MTAVNADQKPNLPATALPRPEFAAGSYLSALDLQTEQHYRVQHMQRHNRYQHSSGVICGLWVVPISDVRQPWAVQICPGYGIDCCGYEILVQEPPVLDVRDHIWRKPPQQRNEIVYIGLRYTESYGEYAPTQSRQCGCEENTYRPARVYDSFKIEVVWTLPDVPSKEDVDLCTDRLVPCPKCSADPILLLARIVLPNHESELITHEHIEHFPR